MFGFFAVNGVRAFGRLPTHMPLEVLRTMPDLTGTDAFKAYAKPAWYIIPQQLRKEMSVIADQIGSRYQALMWNAHYEILGGGCVSAALPGPDGYVFHRRLEWDVGFTPEFRFERLSKHAFVRYTPGYVGALSGYNEHIHIAMNAEPGLEPVNIPGLPISWYIRKALVANWGIHRTAAWLVEQRAIRGAFVIIASKNEAVWIHTTGRFDREYLLCKTFPEPLVVGNSYHEIEMDNCGWDAATAGTYKADSPDDWVLDQYIMPIA